MTLQIVVTNAGRAALVNASHTGSLPVTIAAIGVSTTAIAPAATATSLAGELKRIATLGGVVVAADTMHVLVRDETADAYTMRSFGLYLADGTLFAIYGQSDPIIDKVASSIMLLAVDVQFADVAAASISFGDTNFVDPPASTGTPGVIEIADDAEAQALTDALRALTPRGLGLVFTAAKILSKLLAVDGAGSGLDADLLDGQQGSYYTDIVGRLGYTPFSNAGGLISGSVAITANDLVQKNVEWRQSGRTSYIYANASAFGAQDTVAGGLWSYSFTDGLFRVREQLAWHAGNDGAGSGLDADLLDGREGSSYALLGAFAGFSSVTVGTSANAGIVYLGTNGAHYLYYDGAQYNLPGGELLVNSSIAWTAGNDGSGSGMDADLLDGQQGTYYTDIVGRLGYAPFSAAGGFLGGSVVFSGVDAAQKQIEWRQASRTTYLYANATACGLQDTLAGGVWSHSYVDGLFRILGQIAWTAGNDGAGSGLDADLLDGREATYFLPAGNYTAADLRQKLLSVDGAGSGIDADLLDGYESSAFAKVGATVQFADLIAARNNAANQGVYYFGSALSAYLYFDGVAYSLLGGPLNIGGNVAWNAGNDGSGSGLDADLLDGHDAAFFLPAGGYTANDVKAKLLTVDGAGSGIDADLLDGHEASDFALLSAFGNNLSGNGYQELPGGLIIQWGNAAHTDNSGGQPVEFPIPFPTACVNSQATNSAGGPPAAFHGTGSISKTGMTIYSSQIAGNAALAGTAFRWLAIGF